MGYDAVSKDNQILTSKGNNPYLKGQNVLDMDAPSYPRRMEWSIKNFTEDNYYQRRYFSTEFKL
jgi:hypothetical protein